LSLASRAKNSDLYTTAFTSAQTTIHRNQQLLKNIPHKLAGRQHLKEADASLSLIGWSDCYGICYWLARSMTK